MPTATYRLYVSLSTGIQGCFAGAGEGVCGAGEGEGDCEGSEGVEGAAVVVLAVDLVLLSVLATALLFSVSAFFSPLSLFAAAVSFFLSAAVLPVNPFFSAPKSDFMLCCGACAKLAVRLDG